MRFHYDKEADALYIRFDESPYEKSEVIQQGVIFDYDKKGRIIGIEVLDASRKFPARFRAAVFSNRFPLTVTSE